MRRRMLTPRLRRRKPLAVYTTHNTRKPGVDLTRASTSSDRHCLFASLFLFFLPLPLRVLFSLLPLLPSPSCVPLHSDMECLALASGSAVRAAIPPTPRSLGARIVPIGGGMGGERDRGRRRRNRSECILPFAA